MAAFGVLAPFLFITYTAFIMRSQIFFVCSQNWRHSVHFVSLRFHRAGFAAYQTTKKICSPRSAAQAHGNRWLVLGLRPFSPCPGTAPPFCHGARVASLLIPQAGAKAARAAAVAAIAGGGHCCSPTLRPPDAHGTPAAAASASPPSVGAPAFFRLLPLNAKTLTRAGIDSPRPCLPLFKNTRAKAPCFFSLRASKPHNRTKSVTSLIKLCFEMLRVNNQYICSMNVLEQQLASLRAYSYNCYLVALLLQRSGGRISEILNCTWADYFADGTLFVKGLKRSRNYSIYAPEFLTIYPNVADKSQLIFGSLNRSSVHRAFIRFGICYLKQGNKKYSTTHSFRHLKAKAMREAKFTPKQLQDHLHHNSIKSQNFYK